MLIRCCVLLSVLCGVASADSKGDHFSKGFGNVFPSPFTTPFPDHGPKFWSLGPMPPGIEILPQQQGVFGSPNECAIPLTQMTVPKDRQFSIQKFKAIDGSTADDIVKPAMPVCKR